MRSSVSTRNVKAVDPLSWNSYSASPRTVVHHRLGALRESPQAKEGESMTPEQWRRVFAIVKASQDLPEGERGSFLAQQCANDEEVHGAARSLILAQGQMGSFLEGSTERANSPNADANQALSRGSSTAKGNEPSALPLGTNLGRYVVQDLLGSGGMGVVYAAYDPELDRKVAIKLLHPKASNRLLGSEGRSWLLREAQAMARLYHPNVVSGYGVGRVEEQGFV